MKKLTILTSVLALAACGGGSGGGAPSAPVAARAAITSDSAAAQSNAAITSMASEILVRNGSAIAPSARIGTATYNGMTYKSYRLDDVEFKMAGDDSKIRFVLDNDGKIVSAGKYDKNNVLSKEGIFSRSSDSGSEFGSAKILYGWSKSLSETGLVDEFDGITFPVGVTASSIEVDLASHLDEIDVQSDDANIDAVAALKDAIAEEIQKWADSQPSNYKEGSWLNEVVEAATEFYQGQITSAGNPTEYSTKLNVLGADIGLKYADLGFAQLQVAEKDDPSWVVEDTVTPYVGGYSVLNRNVVQDGTEFTGTALAGVEHTASNGDKKSVLVRQDDAKLTLNTNGSSRLVMDNLVRVEKSDGKTVVTGEGAGHWYELTVEKGAGANGTPTFTVGGSNTMDTRYNLPNGLPGAPVAFTANEYNPSEHEYARSDTDHDTRYGGSVSNNVYGTSASDLEATSTFGFSNENTSTHEEVAIYGAFGGKPTE